jgi:hypothetical protein
MGWVDLDRFMGSTGTKPRVCRCIGKKLDAVSLDFNSVHLYINSLGQELIGGSCKYCGRFEFLGDRRAAELGIDKAEVPLGKDSSCGICGGGGCSYCVATPCERCGLYRKQHQHHLAPKKLFLDWHMWPTINLCRPCHTEWHQRFTPLLRPIKVQAVSCPSLWGAQYLTGDRTFTRSYTDVYLAGFYPARYYDEPPATKHCVRCWRVNPLFLLTFGTAGENWPSHHICASCANVYQRQLLLVSKRTASAAMKDLVAA